MDHPTRITPGRTTSAVTGHLRRLTLALSTLVAVLVLSATVAAKAPITSTEVGEMPTTGGMRPGPVGLNPPTTTFSRGVLPAAIQIDKAQVDAEVETIEIADGVMQNPTGPWVVSWYKETARLGENGNTVMAGHVDYWDVGPAVFYNLRDLSQGDQIQVTGEDGKVFTYAVDWIETYSVADLTPEQINEIVGPTDDPALTLITCGGEFNYDTGEYLSRRVVRATQVGVDAGTGDAPTGEDTASRVDASAPVVEGGTAVVVETGVNVRAEPSTASEVVTVLDGGATVTITGPSEEGDGLIWWPVEDADGNTGYIAEDFLSGQE